MKHKGLYHEGYFAKRSLNKISHALFFVMLFGTCTTPLSAAQQNKSHAKKNKQNHEKMYKAPAKDMSSTKGVDVENELRSIVANPEGIKTENEAVWFDKSAFADTDHFFLGVKSGVDKSGGPNDGTPNNLTKLAALEKDANKPFSLVRVVVQDTPEGRQVSTLPLAPEGMTTKINNVDAQANPLFGRSISHLVVDSRGRPVAAVGGDAPGGVNIRTDPTHLYLVKDINTGQAVLTNRDAGNLATDNPIRDANAANAVSLQALAATKENVPYKNAGAAPTDFANFIFAAVSGAATWKDAQNPGIAVVRIDEDHLTHLKAADFSEGGDGNKNSAKVDSAQAALFSIGNPATLVDDPARNLTAEIELYWDDQTQTLYATQSFVKTANAQNDGAVGIFMGKFDATGNGKFELKPVIALNAAAFDATGVAKQEYGIFGAKTGPNAKDVALVHMSRPRVMHTSTNKDYLLVTGGVVAQPGAAGVARTLSGDAVDAWVNALPLVPAQNSDGKTNLDVGKLAAATAAGGVALENDFETALTMADQAFHVNRLKDIGGFGVHAAAVVGSHPRYLAATAPIKVAEDTTIGGAQPLSNLSAATNPRQGSKLKVGSILKTASKLGQGTVLANGEKLLATETLPADTVIGDGTEFVGNGAAALLPKDMELNAGTVIQANITLPDGSTILNGPTIIPNASTIGENSVLKDTQVIGADTQLIMVDPIAITVLGKDSVIGDLSTIGVGSVFNANNTLKTGTMLGAGTTIAGDGTKIPSMTKLTSGTMIGQGSKKFSVNATQHDYIFNENSILGGKTILKKNSLLKNFQVNGAQMTLPNNTEFPMGTIFSPDIKFFNYTNNNIQLPDGAVPQSIIPKNGMLMLGNNTTLTGIFNGNVTTLIPVGKTITGNKDVKIVSNLDISKNTTLEVLVGGAIDAKAGSKIVEATIGNGGLTIGGAGETLSSDMNAQGDFIVGKAAITLGGDMQILGALTSAGATKIVGATTLAKGVSLAGMTQFKGVTTFNDDGANSGITLSGAGTTMKFAGNTDLKAGTMLNEAQILGGSLTVGGGSALKLGADLKGGNFVDTKKVTVMGSTKVPGNGFVLGVDQKFQGQTVLGGQMTLAQNEEVIAAAGLALKGESSLADNSVIKMNSVLAGTSIDVKVCDVHVVGDSVYIGLDEDRSADNGTESGIFKSKALFNEQGVIRSWTPWQRTMGSTDATCRFGYDANTGNFLYLTTKDGKPVMITPGDPASKINPASTVKVTQWGEGDSMLHGTDKRLFDAMAAVFGGNADVPGVRGLFNFDEETPGFKPFIRGFDVVPFSMMVATGNGAVAFIQTGKADGKQFVPTKEFNVGTEVIAFGQDTTLAQSGTPAPASEKLSNLGTIQAAEFSRMPGADSGWFFVGGDAGLAVLRRVDAAGAGKGTSALEALMDKNTPANFPAGSDWQWLQLKGSNGISPETFPGVRKLVADGVAGFLYVLTVDKLFRIKMSDTNFKGNAAIAENNMDGVTIIADVELSKDATLANKILGGDNDQLFDMLLIRSDTAAGAADVAGVLMATTKGLFLNNQADGGSKLAKTYVNTAAQANDSLVAVKWIRPMSKTGAADFDGLAHTIKMQFFNENPGGRLKFDGGTNNTLEGNMYALGLSNPAAPVVDPLLGIYRFNIGKNGVGDKVEVKQFIEPFTESVGADDAQGAAAGTADIVVGKRTDYFMKIGTVVDGKRASFNGPADFVAVRAQVPDALGDSPTPDQLRTAIKYANKLRSEDGKAAGKDLGAGEKAHIDFGVQLPNSLNFSQQTENTASGARMIHGDFGVLVNE